MKKTSAVFAFFVATCVTVSTGAAADPWTGQGELGYVLVSGNTESETLNVHWKMNKVVEDWKHVAKMSTVRATSNDVDSAESYSAGWRSEYSFSERTYGFGDLRYFDDKFDSYSKVYTASIGIGYQVIAQEHKTWDVSIGAGYRETEIELTGEDASGVSYLLESDYNHTLTETTEFENYTRVDIGEDNTFSQNITGISVSINSSLALKASQEVRHDSNPEPGFKSVDRITSINIVYKF